MGSQLITSRYGAAMAGTGRGNITQDIVDIAAGRMDGLEHYFDPLALNGPQEISYSKGDHRLIGYTFGSYTIGPVAGRFNNKTVLQCPGGGGDLQIGPGGAGSQSWTFVAAASFTSAALAGSGLRFLMSVYNPDTGSSLVGIWLDADADYLVARPGPDGEYFNTTPAADTAFVVAISYDASTSDLKGYINNTNSVALSATRAAGAASVGAKVQIGHSLGATSTAWEGEIGKCLLFNKAWHLSADDKSRLNGLMGDMRTFYGIA